MSPIKVEPEEENRCHLFPELVNKARPERAIVFELEAWDVNCRQHITARYSEAEMAPAVNKLVARIKELEEEVARLKGTAS